MGSLIEGGIRDHVLEGGAWVGCPPCKRNACISSCFTLREP